MSTFMCQHCNKAFDDEETLGEHLLQKHSGKNLYHCAICNKNCPSEWAYSNHILTHSDANLNRKFECTQCPSIFKHRTHLYSHVKKKHTTVKSDNLYKCKECRKEFVFLNSLQRHKETVHLGAIVLHKCDVCDKMYNSKNSLRRHVSVAHSGFNQRSPCPYCPSEFKWRHHLKSHIKTKHVQMGYIPSDLMKNGLTTQDKTNKCCLCSKQFEKKLDFYFHLRGDHKQTMDIFKCCVCDGVFRLENTLRNHLDLHRSKRDFERHRCDQCYPVYAPKPCFEDKQKTSNQKDRSKRLNDEIVDFEITLLEDEDLRNLLKYYTRINAKKNMLSQNKSIDSTNENTPNNKDISLLFRQQKDIMTVISDEAVDNNYINDDNKRGNKVNRIELTKELQVKLIRLPLEKLKTNNTVNKCNETSATSDDNVHNSNIGSCESFSDVSDTIPCTIELPAELRCKKRNKMIQNSPRKKNTENHSSKSKSTISVIEESVTNISQNSDLHEPKGSNEIKERDTIEKSNNTENEVMNNSTISTQSSDTAVHSDIATDIENFKCGPKIKIYRCKYCNINFTNPLTMSRHMKKEHKREKRLSALTCPVCKEQFDSFFAQKSHVKNSHKEKTCSMCKITFPNHGRYANHMRHIHSKKNNSGKKSNISSNLDTINTISDANDATQTSHTKAKPYECGRCVLFFATKLELLQHVSEKHLSMNSVIMNTLPTLLVCDFCNANFSNKKDLIKHLDETHSDRRSYKCIKCAINFNTEKDFNDHVKAEHRHKCGVCLITFVHHDKLMNHMKSVHNNSKIHKCKECNSVFNLKSILWTHMDIEHGTSFSNKFECPKCSLRFSTNFLLKKHLLSHTNPNLDMIRVDVTTEIEKSMHKCLECKVLFPYEVFLQHHMLWEHSKDATSIHKCWHCAALFNEVNELKEHLDIEHQGHKNFV